MSQTPFMPLWVADFVGDTLDLDAKEIGAYMLILMALWGRDGYLPSDEKKLQRVARCGRDWPRIWGAISHYFTVEGDKITQGRLLKELQKVASKREVNAQSGSRGGKAKALKSKDGGLASATISPKQPEPEPYKVREIGKPISAHDEKFDEFWQQYPHRNGAKKGKAAAQKAWVAAIKARASPDEIIGGAMRYANDRQVLQGYAKDPSTWLNQKGWNDDIEPDSPRIPSGAHHGGPRRSHDSMVAGFAAVANQLARRQEPN